MFVSRSLLITAYTTKSHGRQLFCVMVWPSGICNPSLWGKKQSELGWHLQHAAYFFELGLKSGVCRLDTEKELDTSIKFIVHIYHLIVEKYCSIANSRY